MKKRGFGVGKWNGAGGKFDREKGDKNLFDTALRETKEEIGVEIKNPEKVAFFTFRYPGKDEWQTSLFLAKEWSGQPKESEEMLPKWFDFKDIPYKDMWPDDSHWMPRILKGEKLKASFIFDKENKILEHKIEIVEKI